MNHNVKMRATSHIQQLRGGVSLHFLYFCIPKCVCFKIMARFHLFYELMTASSSFSSFYYSFGKRAQIEYGDSRLDTSLSVDYRYCYEWICFKNSSNNHQICLYMSKQRNRNARPGKYSDAAHYYFSIRAIFETFSNSLASTAFWLWWYKYLLR